MGGSGLDVRGKRKVSPLRSASPHSARDDRVWWRV